MKLTITPAKLFNVCTICGTLSDNCIHCESMIICDLCEDDFKCMTEHNDVCAEFGAFDEDEFEDEESEHA